MNRERLELHYYWDPTKNRYFPKSAQNKQSTSKDPSKQIKFLPRPKNKSDLRLKATPLVEVGISPKEFTRGAYIDEFNKIQLYNKISEDFHQFEIESEPISSTMSHHFKAKLDKRKIYTSTKASFPCSVYIDDRPEENGAILISSGGIFCHKFNSDTDSYELQHHWTRPVQVADKFKNEFCTAEGNKIFLFTGTDKFAKAPKVLRTAGDIMAIKLTQNDVYFSFRNGQIHQYDKRSASSSLLFSHSSVAINNMKLFDNNFLLLYSTTSDFVYCRDVRFLNQDVLFELPHFSDVDWSSNVSHFTELEISPVEPTCFYATRNNGRLFAKYDLLNGCEPLERLDKQILFTKCTDSTVWIFTDSTE